MREITMHKTNELNEAIRVVAYDEPGPGGANHHYRFLVERRNAHGHDVASFQEIFFQNGPIKESGPNGISNEALLAVVMDRLAAFQAGDYACPENAAALSALDAAMGYLKDRTAKRTARGVEGTMAV
jgi:hypothetical protein